MVFWNTPTCTIWAKSSKSRTTSAVSSGDLINEIATAGGTMIFAEFSRIVRSTLQVLEVLKAALELNIRIHIAKDKIVMDDSIQSTIYATVLGLAAEIERNFITLGTKESLAKRKQEITEKGYFLNAKGEKVTSLGRPRGKASVTKLDKREKEIKDYQLPMSSNGVTFA